MKRIAQFRFEGFNSPNNYPNFSDYNTMLTTGNIFHDYRLISKFGIQAPVGTRFVLNGQAIRIGATGIYELDYTVNVKQLHFEAETEALVDYIY